MNQLKRGLIAIDRHARLAVGKHTEGVSNMIHHTRCVENALCAIGENNMATLASGDAYDMAHMPSEDDATAIQWIEEGNVNCRCEEWA
jgi:hypothetical protein